MRATAAAVLDQLTQARTLDLRLAERNETPLIWAVSQGYVDIALTLVEAGARLDAQNSDGRRPPTRATRRGRGWRDHATPWSSVSSSTRSRSFGPARPVPPSSRRINLNAEDRFVATQTLRDPSLARCESAS